MTHLFSQILSLGSLKKGSNPEAGALIAPNASWVFSLTRWLILTIPISLLAMAFILFGLDKAL